MKNEKKLILCVIITSIFGASLSSAAAADLTFGNITASPSSPAALSTVTFSIDISGGTPSEVKVTVEECNENTGICYPDVQNISMSLGTDGKYEADVTLKHNDATYITCQVVAKTNDTWISSSDKKILLSEDTNGDTNGDGNNNTPGFEVMLLLVAIGALILFIGRKRIQ
jgi:hypothetical protein